MFGPFEALQTLNFSCPELQPRTVPDPRPSKSGFSTHQKQFSGKINTVIVFSAFDLYRTPVLVLIGETQKIGRVRHRSRLKFGTGKVQGFQCFEGAKHTPGPPRFWRSMACFEGPLTGYNISKFYVPPLGRVDGTRENVREKRVFPYAHVQSRIRADGHNSATERNFFKWSTVVDRAQLGVQRKAKVSTSIFGGHPTLV